MNYPAQICLARVPWMIKPDDATAIDDDEGGSGAGAVGVEIVRIERNSQSGNICIIARKHALDELFLLLRRGFLPACRDSIKLGRT